MLSCGKFEESITWKGKYEFMGAEVEMKSSK